MFSNLINPPFQRRQNTLSMLKGLDAFMRRYKGRPEPGVVDGVLVNEEYIVNNSLHEERGRGNYLPTNSATSESQVQVAMGYLEAYRATGQQQFLDEAIKYADAYVRHYFTAFRLPAKAGPWRAHWLINGKAPFYTWGPIDWRDYQNSGAFEALVTITNGVGRAPQGSPWYGEKLRQVYSAYTPGAPLQWRNVFAEVGSWVRTPEGEDPPQSYQIAWFVDMDRVIRRGDGTAWTDTPPAEALGSTELLLEDGDQLLAEDGTPLANEEPVIGRFKLQDDTFSGDLHLVMATESGHLIQRNQGFDAWPMWRPLDTGESASAFDAELWHTELFQALFEETEEEKWLRAWGASVYSIDEATNIETGKTFFEQTTSSTYPFTQGVAYGFTVGQNSRGKISRDNAGLIRLEKDQELFEEDESWMSIEQIGLVVRMNPVSELLVNWGTSQRSGYMSALIDVKDDVNQAQADEYRASRLFRGSLQAPGLDGLRMNGFIRNKRSDNTGYKLAQGPAVAGFGDFSVETREATILDRVDLHSRISLRGGIAGALLGFWMSDPKTLPLPLSLTYQTITTGRIYARFKDANGWLWWKELPATTGWSTINLSWSDLTPSQYQEKSGTPPSSPAPAEQEFVEIVPHPDTPENTLQQIDIYCAGELPPLLTKTDFVITALRLRFYDWREFVVRVGDVYANNAPDIEFAYSPGVVPFTYDTTLLKGKKFWRGSPYVGYQYPSVWAQNGYLERANQVVQFYKDAQDDYASKKGHRGPWTPVFYWPKWDNIRYGQAGEFGWPGPDPNTFWGGFQARTVHSAAHLWKVLVKQGDPVPADLPAIVEDYARFLNGFLAANGNLPPTDFPEDGDPFAGYVEPHIMGLNMVALVYAKQAGSTDPAVDEALQRTYDGLTANYVTTGEMAGSFSPAPQDRVFYGFWVGEIMRALAVYYAFDLEGMGEPLDRRPVEPVEIELEDGSGSLLLENGDALRMDRPAPIIVTPITLEDGGMLLLEDGDYVSLE